MIDYWKNLSSSPIDVDRVIAGLHNVELLEGITKYTHRKSLYFPKVVEALEQLPVRYWDAALAVFGAVVYVPKDFLSAALEYLWWAARNSAASSGNPLSGDAHDVLLMEVDQDGLVPDFARQNGLSARLNGAVHPRLNDVQLFRFALSHVHHGTVEEREHAAGQLRLAAQKKAWIVLTDKALSGQSLLGDLKKIAYTRDLLTMWTGERPAIYVSAQIATSAAEAAVEQWTQEDGIDAVEVLSAVRLDERARVGSAHCRLFSDQSTHDMVLDLCEWFDEHVVARDLSLSGFRENSGDSLVLGYRQTGLTLVDYENTPTNSLPLLWFNAMDPSARYDQGHPRPRYVGPFPRVHSRRGQEDGRLSESALWKDLLTETSGATILERLKG